MFFKKRIFKRLFIISTVTLIAFSGVYNFVNAQSYKIHEKIPGQEGTANYGAAGIDTLQEYLEAAYKFGIAIVAMLAVIMIGVGGFMYIVTSAGNAGKLADAKSIITSALVGLVMALLSWLILFVVNPDLVGTTLGGKGVELSSSDIAAPGSGPDPTVCSVRDENGVYKKAYEMSPCSGDKFCLEDTCVYKDSICLIGGVKIDGVCDESKYIAQNGQPCGVVVSNKKELSGVCMVTEKCKKGTYTELNGKQCLVDAVCCVDGL